MEKKMVQSILSAAFAAPVVPVRASGCGRVYVSISSSDKALVNAVSAAAKAMGKIFQRKGYMGMRNVLYIGYDNASGRELAKGEAIAAYLSANGIPAYMDAQGD
jgi:hypothetical protein